jgi:large subunit ribosomal protein L29
MKGPEVHQLDEGELERFVVEARKELLNLRFQNATGQLENSSRIREAKKDLARGLTVARKRGIDVETRPTETDG